MILIEHATVVTVDRERRILRDGSVLVDGSDIVQVGPAREVRPPRPPVRLIDGRSRVVLPGFVDTHVHLSEHLNRGLLLDDIPVDRYLPDWLIPLYSVMTSEEEHLDTPEWRPILNPLNNLVYAATGASVRTVLIDGRIVLDEGRLTTVDEKGVYERVETLAREQIARAGLRIESKWPVI